MSTKPTKREFKPTRLPPDGFDRWATEYAIDFKVELPGRRARAIAYKAWCAGAEARDHEVRARTANTDLLARIEQLESRLEREEAWNNDVGARLDAIENKMCDLYGDEK